MKPQPAVKRRDGNADWSQRNLREAVLATAVAIFDGRRARRHLTVHLAM